MTNNTSRRALAAYAAGLAAIGGLMVIVALGGTAVGPKNAAPALSSAQMAAPGGQRP